MTIKLYWVFFHGGIESIWLGWYFIQQGYAVGRELGSADDDLWEKITVTIDGSRVSIEGGNFTGQLIGKVWSRTQELLEVEFIAD